MIFLWKKNKDIINGTFKNIEMDLIKIMKDMDMFINE